VSQQPDPILMTQWIEDCDHSEDAVPVLSHIVQRYNESHRRYHNLAHAQAVVARVTMLGEHADQGAVRDLRIAAWIHDVIYNPGAPNNELLSAEFAQTELTISKHRINRVAALVVMTADHEPADEMAAILMDADLWTLGGPQNEYFAYGALIREEYAHVPDEAWRRGRARFIETFVRRDHIFHTTIGRNEREPQARRNLALELTTLGLR
jgi:predicted metal-dependent HD superfamily phosphohydrolase